MCQERCPPRLVLVLKLFNIQWKKCFYIRKEFVQKAHRMYLGQTLYVIVQYMNRIVVIRRK